MERIAGDLCLSDRVHFLGRLSAPEIAAELSTCHTFVLASRIENSPNSLCEAQFVGAPVVAACVGGVPSLVDHMRTGLLYPEDDHAVLAHYLDRIFSDDVLAAKIGREGREVARRRHASHLIVDQVCSIYTDIVGRYGNGA
jgi:glycosyltransferase involved in cell wall biosynthesis